ncbi:hypothetical protein Tco_0857580 [Tanacetum coccineum]|uniref:Uncharacterized protein n=1 Tax=Tanacetum coccineum TaxID=301880 RepID=A0ABQ5B7Q3_9ASTR
MASSSYLPLNFVFISGKTGLVRGLPKLKFEKDQLCSAMCKRQKSSKKSPQNQSETAHHYHDDEIIHEEDSDEDDSSISSSDDEDSDDEDEGTNVEGEKTQEEATETEDQGNEECKTTSKLRTDLPIQMSSERPETRSLNRTTLSDHAWNTSVPAIHESVQPGFAFGTTGPRESFDELNQFDELEYFCEVSSTKATIEKFRLDQPEVKRSSNDDKFALWESRFGARSDDVLCICILKGIAGTSIKKDGLLLSHKFKEGDFTDKDPKTFEEYVASSRARKNNIRVNSFTNEDGICLSQHQNKLMVGYVKMVVIGFMIPAGSQDPYTTCSYRLLKLKNFKERCIVKLLQEWFEHVSPEVTVQRWQSYKMALSLCLVDDLKDDQRSLWSKYKFKEQAQPKKA